MTVDEFKALLKTQVPSRDICQRVLMSSDMWLVTHKKMGDSAQVHDQMTRFFASKLKMAKQNVAFVGSAKTGFSLHPDKNFRNFDDERSDIDVILVWPSKFSEFWAELLRMFYADRNQVEANYRKE